MSKVAEDYLDHVVQSTKGIHGAAAVELLSQAAAENPRDPRPLVLLAAELVEQGQVDGAEAAYVTALQRAPGLGIARFQLGLLQVTSGRPAAGLATWAPLEELGEGDPLCLFKRGLEAIVLSRFEEGHRWIRAGQEANQVNEPLNRDMQGVLDRLERAGQLQPEGAAPAPEPASAAAPPADQNFFLSGYGRKS